MTTRLSRAERYMTKVIEGKIPACKWVKLACQRHFRDLKKYGKKKNAEYYFDRKAADYAEDYFSEVLKHPKDSIHVNAGDPFALEDWEVAMITYPVFGWKRRDGTRKYRRVYVEIPKKNGKSSTSAGLADLLLTADNEHSAEVYSVAGSREQAAIVFDIAKNMAVQSPELIDRLEIFKRTITYPSAYSKYSVMSADAPQAHGINAHGVLFDELHVQPNRLLFDALWGAGKARRQPLFVMLTTAGFDRTSVAYEIHNYAQQVLDGIQHDENFWGVIYTIDDGDNWLDPKSWRKANPNLGVTIGMDAIAEEAAQAKAIPGFQNNFKRLALNVWTQSDERVIPAEMWDACRVEPEPLDGRACYGGLDLASSNDIAAFVLDFPEADGESHIWLPFFWIPEENIIERGFQHNVNYDAWARDGFIRTTPGNTIDLRHIVNDIIELGQAYDIKQIAFDRWGAREVSNDLQDAGFKMAEFGQGYKSMAAPTKEFLRMTAAKLLHHEGHPVLAWMADNLALSTDPAGNLKPDKGKVAKLKKKIDGIVAGVMALDVALRQSNKPASVYSKRGIRTLG